MPIDSDVTKYAESLFDHRLSEEIRPAYVNRLRELRTKYQGSAQQPFSGIDAQRLIEVETQFAKQAAIAQVECLAAALTKRGLNFDDEAFRKGLDDTRKLLERHSQQATRRVLAKFTHRGSPPDQNLKTALEQDVDAEMKRIHDSVFGLLKLKLHESVVTASAKAQQPAKAKDDDYAFARLAIEEARKSVSEQDGRKHPKVGAAVVKNGQVLSTAHRGEQPTNHAEFVALEKKLSDEAVAGATIYTTLEPCTTRNHPKIPCAARLIERKVARVVIGMLDPDPRITGRGIRSLRSANIAIGLFPPDLMSEVEEMNREFIRAQKQKQTPTKTNEGTDHAATIAARLLSDATWDLQKATWSFYALHTQHGVARAARDIADEEKRILEKVDAAFRVFTQDYDIPTDLSAVAKSEVENMNIALVNLKAFSMTGQGTEMEIAATQVQDACERIRIAARRYAYR
jgi:pyrimidine deaminase RibD-like protein